MKRAAMMMVGCFLLAGCSPDTPRGSVWHTYDFRYPVPYQAAVPDPRVNPNFQYLDNDNYYVPPADYGMCSGRDNLLGCE